MRLTLLKAKEALKDKAPADKLEGRINRLHERVLLHGKFQHSIQRLALVAKFGQLTPPRFIRAIEGIKFGNGLVPYIANRWFDFMPRLVGNCVGFSMGMVRDLGDGQPILYDLPAGGTLSSAGTGILTIYGYDEDYAPVTLVMTNNTLTANPFMVITRVHKEHTAAAMTLTHIAADLTQTPLAIMEANEEETYYHRYRIDGKSTEEETNVEAICRLRHIEFTSDQDVLLLSNISALELGMDALQYEAENDHTTANIYLGKCVDILNLDLAGSNSDNTIPTIQFRHIGARPNFIFGY